MTSDWIHTSSPCITNPVIYSAHFDSDSSNDEPLNSNHTTQMNQKTRRFKRPSKNQGTGIPLESLNRVFPGRSDSECIQKVQDEIASLKLELAKQEAKLLRLYETERARDQQPVDTFGEWCFEQEEKKAPAVKNQQAVDYHVLKDLRISGEEKQPTVLREHPTVGKIKQTSQMGWNPQLAHLHLTGLNQPFDWSGFRKEKQPRTLENVPQRTEKLTAETIAQHLERFCLEEQMELRDTVKVCSSRINAFE